MMINILLSIFLGIIGVTILDRVWFDIDYKKAEKGLEVLEHYHHGIVLIALFAWLIQFQPWAWMLFAAGATFIYRECRQDNYFSYHSKHFRNSLVIGLGLLAVTITSYIFLWF